MSDIMQGGELGVVGGFFSQDEVEASDNNACDDKENDGDEETGVVVDKDATDLLTDKNPADHNTNVAEKILDKFAAGVGGVTFDDSGEERINANDNHGARGDVENSKNINQPAPTGAVDEGEKKQVDTAQCKHESCEAFDVGHFDVFADEQERDGACDGADANDVADVGRGEAVFLEPELAEVFPEPDGDAEKGEHGENLILEALGFREFWMLLETFRVFFRPGGMFGSPVADDRVLPRRVVGWVLADGFPEGLI